MRVSAIFGAVAASQSATCHYPGIITALNATIVTNKSKCCGSSDRLLLDFWITAIEFRGKF